MIDDTTPVPAPAADARERVADLEAELTKCFDEIAYHGHIASEQRSRAEAAEAEVASLRAECERLRGATAEYRAAEIAMEEEGATVDADHRYYAARDALDAALAATPQPAEAGTGADHRIRVNGCWRCGEDHTMDFYALANPVDDYQWWGLCPVTRQPVFLAIRAAALDQDQEATDGE